MKNQKIAIIGAGPVGIVLAIKLHAMGFRAVVFEERSRQQIVDGNDERSINITLSKRGMDALRNVDCADAVIEKAARVAGRKYYLGNTSYFVPYTLLPGNYLYSIKRKHLEHVLINSAENKGIEIRFDHKLTAINFLNRTCSFAVSNQSFAFDFLFGADGAHSKVRNLLHTQCTISTNEFVYKRIPIDEENARKLKLPCDAVVIFPSAHGMLLSLPNADHTHSGLMHIKNSILDTVYNNPELLQKYFPHLVEKIDDFKNKFFRAQVGAFGSVACTKWFWRNSILLLGDAAHAMLPFYGQGTNSGLEDVMILTGYLGQNNDDFLLAAKHFQDTRPEATTAISELSYENLKNLEAHDFTETLTLKFLSLALEEKFPDCSSEYFRVAFSNAPFQEAREFSKKYASIVSGYANRKGVKGQMVFPEALLTEIYSHFKKAA